MRSLLREKLYDNPVFCADWWAAFCVVLHGGAETLEWQAFPRRRSAMRNWFIA
jgi:hypothetical protein